MKFNTLITCQTTGDHYRPAGLREPRLGEMYLNTEGRVVICSWGAGPRGIRTILRRIEFIRNSWQDVPGQEQL